MTEEELKEGTLLVAELRDLRFKASEVVRAIDGGCACSFSVNGTHVCDGKPLAKVVYRILVHQIRAKEAALAAI